MLLALAWPLAVPAAEADAQAAFQRGVAAVQSGDFAAAIEAFEAARAAGLDTGAVHFNLGVAYYRQGELEAARAAFRRATDDPSIAAPACYNLGRLAREAGRLADAAEWFERAARVARTPAVRLSARAARDALEMPVAGVDAGAGSLEVGMGLDSNVPFLPIEAAVNTDTDDRFAFGELRLDMATGADSRVFADIYGERYDELDDSDITVVRGGHARRIDTAGWGREARAAGTYVRYGGEALEYRVGVSGTAWRGRGQEGWVDLTAGLDLVRGGADFGYLDGISVSAQAAVGGSFGSSGNWHTGARFAYEDRADLSTGSAFFSFSRTAVEVFGGIGGRFTADLGWSLDARAAARDYAGTERRQGRAVGSRRDNYAEAGATLEWYLDPRWIFTADTRILQRDSNIDDVRSGSNLDDFDFDKTITRFAVRYEF